MAPHGTTPKYHQNLERKKHWAYIKGIFPRPQTPSPSPIGWPFTKAEFKTWHDKQKFKNLKMRVDAQWFKIGGHVGTLHNWILHSSIHTRILNSCRCSKLHMKNILDIKDDYVLSLVSGTSVPCTPKPDATQRYGQGPAGDLTICLSR